MYTEENKHGRESTHSAPNDKHPFLLPPRPLDNLVRALRQRVPVRLRAGDAIQFEHGRRPGERDGVAADAVVHF